MEVRAVAEAARLLAEGRPGAEMADIPAVVIRVAEAPAEAAEDTPVAAGVLVEVPAEVAVDIPEAGVLVEAVGVPAAVVVAIQVVAVAADRLAEGAHLEAEEAAATR